jgi:ribosomal-protein-alanine N-acetyltransferase
VTVPTEVRTERLLLRQWRADDAGRMAEIYADPRFLEHMPANDLPQTRAQLERFARGWSNYGYSHWAVEEASNGRLIGRAGLMRHDDWPLAEYAVEVGWSFDPSTGAAAMPPRRAGSASTAGSSTSRSRS